jgi:hypothetical protein
VLFPEAALLPEVEEPSAFPSIEPTLFPIGDSSRPDKSKLPGDETPVSPVSKPYGSGATASDGPPLTMSTLPPETLAPDPGRPRRRVKRKR